MLTESIRMQASDGAKLQSDSFGLLRPAVGSGKTEHPVTFTALNEKCIYEMNIKRARLTQDFLRKALL
jgi:hypothetical protein